MNKASTFEDNPGLSELACKILLKLISKRKSRILLGVLSKVTESAISADSEFHILSFLAPPPPSPVEAL